MEQGISLNCESRLVLPDSMYTKIQIANSVIAEATCSMKQVKKGSQVPHLDLVKPVHNSTQKDSTMRLNEQ